MVDIQAVIDPYVSPMLLAQWVTTRAISIDLRILAVMHAECPLDAKVAAAQDRSRHLRTAAARCVDMPMVALERLAADPVDAVRRAVVANPRCWAQLWHCNATSSEWQDREAAAANPSFEVDLLAADPDSRVRIAAVMNRTCSVEALRGRKADGSCYVRRAVAANVITPQDVLVPWLQVHDPALRRLIINHPNCPAHIKTIAILSIDE